MDPLTEAEIRASFINASKREVAQATLPPLSELRWERLDYLGWSDRKYPSRSYVVVPMDNHAVGVILRSTERKSRKRAMCAWCEDIVETEDVGLFVAKRAGAAGRNGDTVGTLLHSDFSCSVHVRRMPTKAEAGDNPEAVTAARIEGLRSRSARFVRHLCDEE